MVHAFEPKDLPPPGERAGEPDRGADRLGTGAREAHHVDPGNRVRDPSRRARLQLGRQAEHGAGVFDRADDGSGHRRRPVAEQHRPQSEEVVDVLVAVSVGDPGAAAAGDERRIGNPAGPRTAGAAPHQELTSRSVWRST